MLAVTPIQSPLAEKRITFFTIKKKMIGRRAYTDSIYLKSSHTAKHDEQSISSPSLSSSSCSTPRQSEIEYKALNITGC
jgi:hypothetical protein